jgi:hypothetical protein
LAVLLLANCGGSPTQPSLQSIGGNWIRAYQDSNCGNGTVENTSFRQAGDRITGTLALRLFEAPCSNVPSWTMTGSVNGSEVRLTGQPEWTIADRQFGVCAIEIVATRQGSDRIVGTHRWTNCSPTADGRTVAVTGTIDLRRR